MGPGVRREDENDVLRLPEPSEREQQVERSRWWSRLRGPVGSLILHLLPLLVLIDWPISPPAETAPIPVQLVFDPPPKAAPAPLAREDRGNPKAKRVKNRRGAPPAAKNPPTPEPPPAETKPPEKPQQT